MRVFIAGGSGFIGTALCRALIRSGHSPVVLTRGTPRALPPGVSAVGWNGRDGEGWAHLLERDSAVVNLAGENIAAGRWTPERKERILRSRLAAGQAVAEAVARAPEAPRVLVQASAVGWYGPRGPELLDESAASGQGFLAEVCRRWEESSAAVEAGGTRRCVLRTGLVLGPGGALTRMLPPFRFFLGGPLGDGRQGVSWIHLDDEAQAIRFLIENEDCSGPYNLTAPDPVDSRTFAKALGRALGRPSWLPAPGAALRLLLGEMASEVLLSGQFVRPTRLLAAGYRFLRPDLDGALRASLHPSREAA